MFNYVNDEKFYGWYESVSKERIVNKSALMNELVRNADGPGYAIYTIPASKTVTGKDESYRYKVENIGCCGATTIYIYF